MKASTMTIVILLTIGSAFSMLCAQGFSSTFLSETGEDLKQVTEVLKKQSEQTEISSDQNPDCKPEQKPVTTGSGLDISGFVDVSYFYAGNSGENTFGLDQIEVDVNKSLGESGSIRADLEWVSDGAGGFTVEAEQGFINYTPSFLGSFSLTFGKFNAPIGFELLDAPDMYQYSHALVFDNGLPTNLSGVMISGNLTEQLDLSVYVCNGWDQNVDFNTGKTAGGRLGFTSGETWAGGLSVIHGANGLAEGDMLTVSDVDVSVTAVENLTLGAELNQGREDITDATNTTSTFNWLGYLLMAHYDFSDFLGLTIRYDSFDDKDGSRLETVEKRQAVTVAPTFVLGHGMGALIEIRNDFSDQKVFFDSDGKAVESQLAAALEFTFTF